MDTTFTQINSRLDLFLGDAQRFNEDGGLESDAYGLYLKEDFRAALAEINQALALDSNDGVAHQRRGYILQALGDMGGAESELKQAVDLGVLGTLLDLAELYRKTGDVHKARQCVEQFIEEANKPENNEWWLDLTQYLEEAQSLLKQLE